MVPKLWQSSFNIYNLSVSVIGRYKQKHHHLEGSQKLLFYEEKKILHVFLFFHTWRSIFKLQFLPYRLSLKRALNVLKFSVDFVHRIIRPIIKNNSSIVWLVSRLLLIFGPFFQKQPKNLGGKSGNYWHVGPFVQIFSQYVFYKFVDQTCAKFQDLCSTFLILSIMQMLEFLECYIGEVNIFYETLKYLTFLKIFSPHPPISKLHNHVPGVHKSSHRTSKCYTKSIL